MDTNDNQLRIKNETRRYAPVQNAIWIMQRVVTVPWTPISVYGITTSCSRLFQLFFSSIISTPRLTTFHYAAYRRCDYSLVEINCVIILRIIVVLWNILTLFCTLANINVLNLIYVCLLFKLII